MTVHSLYPAFTRIFYTSQFGEHTMTLPTRSWVDPANPSLPGSYVAWDTVSVDADDMINALVDTLEPLAPADVVWSRAEIYTMADETSAPVLKRIFPLTQVGTNIAAAQVQATQHTYTFFDTGGEILKIVYLDFQATDWAKISSLTGLSANQLAFTGQIVADGNAWSSRAGNQPIMFGQMTRKLNDHLRKKYGMT